MHKNYMVALVNYGTILLILAIVVFIVIGLMTKKWAKSGYFLSGIFFLIGSISIYGADTVSPTQFNDALMMSIFLFGLGFLINSIIGFFSHK